MSTEEAVLQTYTADCVQTAEERSAVFALRMLVFVEEQRVPIEEELDAYDITATHFLIRKAPAPENTEDGVVGTARLIDKGHGTGKIGRVAMHIEHRGVGAGAKLMLYIEEFARLEGYTELLLEAQTYAIGFYEKLGYVAEGDIFMDCDIPHRLMRYRLE
ncbi:acetyltransferase [Armatimonadota bacterium]|nr:acetyltransferase [Armatimonadota bacterium]